MRKWTYLVATLLMAGTTATFTGCIDTDEPEGIANLRGAKAELIKAETAVKQVEVEMQKALVANQELQNKSLELANQRAEYENQLKALDVKLKELDVELKQAKNEAEKARLEAEIAQSNATKAAIENQMAYDAEMFKAKMLEAQEATVRAQQSYDEAMRALEASKLTLTDVEREAIEKAQLFMQQSATTMDSKYAALRIAQEAYYNALVDPNLPSLSVLQADLKIAQIAVEKAEIMLDEKSNMLALAEDFDAAAWDAKIQELDKKVSEYQSEKSKADVELATKKASTEYKAAEEKVTEMVKARRAAKNAYDDALTDSATQVNTLRDIKMYESEPINAGLKDLFSRNSDFRSLTGYNFNTGVFSYSAVQYTQASYDDDLDKDDEALRTSAASVQLRLVNAWVETLKDYSVDKNGVEWNKLTLAEKEEDARNAVEQYKKDKANWDISVKAVKGTATEVPTDGLKEATDAYNASYAAVVEAVKAYNDVYDEIYKTAYDKSISETKAALKKGYYFDRLKDALAAKGTAGQKLDFQNITGNEDEKIKWLETNLPGEVSAASTGADSDVETYYKDAQHNQDLIDNAENAGNAAFAGTDKDEKALAALDEAAQKATVAARKVPSAKNAYKKLAADIYGQLLVNNVTLADMTGSSTSFYGDKLDENNNPTGHKEVLRSDITADEFAKLSETKLDHQTALDALALTSNAVFGSIFSSQDRLVEVTEAMVRTYIEQNGGSLSTNFGTLGIMMSANDDVQLCKDMIEAEELIKPLQAQIDAVYASLDAEIKANTALMDPFIEKVDETRVAWKAAKEDVKTAEEERDALTAEFEANSKRFGALITDYQGLKAIVQQQIDGINNGVVGGSSVTVESVLNYWKNEVAQQEKVVETKKQEVAAKQKAIDLFKDDKYTAAFDLEQKKNALDSADAEYKAAKDVYDMALSQLKALLAALTK